MLLSQTFPVLHEISIVSILVRLILALVCGGIVGLDRNRRGRPAGFRTHMLVCLGAALVMVTNQYISVMFGGGDPARLGAQVISGIGFLGAGSIIITRHYQVTGLTTAAGLWASACVGLAIGIGLYEAAVLACVLILIAEKLLRAPGTKVRDRSRCFDFYVEFADISIIGDFILALQKKNITIEEITRSTDETVKRGTIAAVFRINVPPELGKNDALALILKLQGVQYTEEVVS